MVPHQGCERLRTGLPVVVRDSLRAGRWQGTLVIVVAEFVL